jgi:enolase-phosphatase E1
MIGAIVTDIEGTTSALTFVRDVLFPYARQRLPDFVRAHAHEPAVRAALDALGGDDEARIHTLLGWIDEDRKATPLKTLQGLIWRRGFEAGELVSHVYPDAAQQLRRWRADGLALFVYSSGSVLAQQQYFEHSDQGDLSMLFSGWFDTTTGPKREAESYARIAGVIGAAPGNTLFLSDVVEELDAARAAHFRTCLLARDGGGATPASDHPLARDFTIVTW